LCFQLHEAKLDSWDVKEHLNTLLEARDSCHNCQNSLTSDLTVWNAKQMCFYKELHCKSCVYRSMKPNLTVGTLRNTLIRCSSHVTTVITVKTYSLVTWQYKLPNRRVSLRNCIVSCVYSSMEPNLTVGTLRNTLIRCSSHVTAVITVKTHSPVTWKYKMPNRCVSFRNVLILTSQLSNLAPWSCKHITGCYVLHKKSRVSKIYRVSFLRKLEDKDVNIDGDF